MHTKDGFALLEMLIAIAICTLLTCLTLPLVRMSREAFHRFPEHYLYLQSEALRTGQMQTIEEGSCFNGRGNINQAKTVFFDAERIIMELGFGRLVFPDE